MQPKRQTSALGPRQSLYVRVQNVALTPSGVLMQIMRLWEALWTGHVSPHFHIFMCAGVLGLHRRAIMDADLDFDGILRYCIQLSGRLDMHQVLRCAEKLCILAGHAGQECLTAAGLKP